jgi:hypothetical protein
LQKIRQAILAEGRNPFDVLARIACARAPMTRPERAENGVRVVLGNHERRLAAY